MRSRIVRLDLVRKFALTAQTFGLAHAFKQACVYLRARLRGHAPTTVPPNGPASPQPGYLGPIWSMLAEKDAFHVSNAPSIARKRRKLAIIGDLNLVQCRKYRVEQLAELWANLDADVTFAHFEDVPRAVHILQDATHLMCYRLSACSNVSMFLYEARRLKLPVLYDIDDPLFSVSAYETYGNMAVLNPDLKAQFIKAAPGYLDILNACDAVSVSTPGLADHTREYTNRDVFVRRNFADRATLSAGETALRGSTDNEEIFRVAFASGSQGHEADFAVIRDQVVRFLSKDSRRRLMVLGHFDTSHLPSDLEPQIERHKFSSYDRYLQILAKADCAIMPLADDIFNHCKSAVRAIDAGSVGVPVICSRVGDFSNFVAQGQSGYLMDCDDDWTQTLTELHRDRTTTHAMGLRARRVLKTRWPAHSNPNIIDADLVKWVTT